MKPTDFAKSLQKFFEEYLVHQRGSRENTIKSYRDTFKLFLEYMSECKSMRPSNVTLASFTAETIADFRKHLAKNRKNSEKTRNLRMAAIHSFVRFLQYERPEKIVQWQKIQSLPSQRGKHEPVKYLTQKETAALMSVIKTNTRKGIRDKAMILLLYDTGARVQELADLCVADIRLGTMPQVKITGKGGKTRFVPLMSTTVAILKEYMKVFSLSNNDRYNDPLFKNQRGEKLTRFGIAFVLQGYVEKTRSLEKTIPEKVSPHQLRHSKAMHLLEEGCSEIVIQHLLGHSDLKTTGIYAKANMKMTRAALEKVNKECSSPPEGFTWQKDENILEWLKNL